MAVELYDDHEQGERVKQWMKDNGGGILLGVVLAVGGLFGFRYWQASQTQHAYNAGEIYAVVNDQIAEITANAGAAADPETGEQPVTDEGQMLDALATLQNDYSDNLYAALATLQVADYKIENDDLEAASSQYQFIINNSDNQQIRAIAILRLARTQLAQQQPETALQTLSGLPADSGQEAMAARIRGESYIALGQREQALAAFEQAEEDLGGTPDRMLELRLADLRDIDVDSLLQNAAATETPPVFDGVNNQNTSSVTTPTVINADSDVTVTTGDGSSETIQVDAGTPGITEVDDGE